MKTPPLRAALAAAFLSALAPLAPAARADTPTTPSLPGPGREEVRTFHFATGPGPGKPAEPVTFLGVETSPTGATLTDQLGLPAGVGLVVQLVVPDSPAAAVLKPHDILTKLNDQILIETRQLAVLVRTYKEGDEIALTYLRGGKEATAKVKLARRALPVAFGLPHGPGLNAVYRLRPGAAPADAPMPRMDVAPGPHVLRVFRQEAAGGGGVTAVNPGNSQMMLTDDHGSLAVSIKDGARTLVAKDPAGKTLFDGPVDTPEQQKALPDAVRGRFDQMQNLEYVSFDAEPEDEPFAEGAPLPPVETLAPAGPL